MSIYSWMSFLCLWIYSTFVVLAFSNYLPLGETKYLTLFPWLIIYGIYIAVNRNASERPSLQQQDNPENINRYMKKCFYIAPEIDMKVECYHTEGGGEYSDSTTVITSSECQRFEYFTWRDISGLFRLEKERAIFSCWKYYILLELKFEVSLAEWTDFIRL
jgi:hypothetical protein